METIESKQVGLFEKKKETSMIGEEIKGQQLSLVEKLNLETKINILNEEIAEKTSNALAKYRRVSKWKSPYPCLESKHELKEYIISYLKEKSKVSKEFEEKLGAILNKDLLKKVVRGIQSAGELSPEFLNCLSDWEKAYFFAGRQNPKNPRNPKNPDLDLYQTTLMYIKRGVEVLHEQHSAREDKGRYRRKLVLPEEKEIRARKLWAT